MKPYSNTLMKKEIDNLILEPLNPSKKKTLEEYSAINSEYSMNYGKAQKIRCKISECFIEKWYANLKGYCTHLMESGQY